MVSVVWITLIFNSLFLTNSSYKIILTTSFFTTQLTLLKPTGVVSSLPMPNLLISDFKLAKSIFLSKFDVSTPVAFLNILLSHN